MIMFLYLFRLVLTIKSFCKFIFNNYVNLKFYLFRVGFPIMISTTATASFYLVIAHVVFNWH